ncbi:10 kDa heat shock protein, mitochondrial [Lepeophtheirus salmonis]|uniref:10 kDa heat shock protein, mitochondrial n=1 Tax=Lepeophtheirus salmonis TaxID=72036 RepID=D3PJJ1_LEPSM|nr:10 kDa heat shock protein, mitochondrial-like [Lepeophtheirus salmonis]ADD38727.1 10 kDa heat shock protein, mitochondrial [Lepeophtheirus salmonis]
MANTLRRFKPLMDRVLVQRGDAISKTKSGILLPEKAQDNVREATVIAVGPGSRSESGALNPMSLKEGDTVLLPEFGGSKLTFEDKEYSLFREAEIIAKFSDS